MKRLLFVATMAAAVALYIQVSPAQDPGVEKLTETEVIIGAGTLKLEVDQKTEATKQRKETKTNWKGKGPAGKMLGMVLKSGKQGQIINLPEGIITDFDHKGKCETKPIGGDTLQSVLSSLKGIMQASQQESEKYANLEEEESEWEILESVFKVEDLNKHEKKYGFPNSNYRITAFNRMQHKQTGQIQVDSVSIHACMTPETEELKRARDIERAFTLAYLDSLGMEPVFDDLKESLFGGKILEKMNTGIQSDPRFKHMADQLKQFDNKVPIVTETKYFQRKTAPKTDVVSTDIAEVGPDKKETDVSDLKKQAKTKGFGLAKSVFGKKTKKTKVKPIVTIKHRTKKWRVTNYNSDVFALPSDCT